MQHIVIDPSGALPSALQAFLVPDEPRAIGLAIDALIARLDEASGDPDAEDDGTAEEDGTQLDGAWVEWNTMRGASKRGPNLMLGEEDDEDDDPAEEGGDEADTGNGEDELLGGLSLRYADENSGCPIADPGGCEHNGQEQEEGVLVPLYGVDQTKLPKEAR